jgi:predicted phosphodiesterase
MKLQVASDMHLDCYATPESDFILKNMKFKSKISAFVIAGDLANGPRVMEFLEKVLRTMPQSLNLLYTLGNHDNWDHNPVPDIERINDSRFIFMNRRKIELDGKRIIGATGWFPVKDNIATLTRDYGRVPGGKDKIKENRELDLTFLTNALKKKADLTITHHACCERSLHNPYWPSRDFYNGAFDKLMPMSRNWVHGHCHVKLDYTEYGCKVKTDPWGYEDGNIHCGKPFVIEI